MYQRYMTNTNQQPKKQGKPPTGEMGSFRQNRQNPQNPTQPAHSPKPQPHAGAANRQISGTGRGTGAATHPGSPDHFGIPGRSGGGGAPRFGQNQKPRSAMPPTPKEPIPKKQSFSGRDTILGLLPPSLYNPRTKKILGFLSAEDLLLAALIFLMLDSDKDDDSIMVYVLLYLLLSDYIDLPF